MNLALFDFDHTITTADSYAGFLRYIASPEEYSRAKRLLAPWLAGYRLGLVSAECIRARITRIAFSERHEWEIREQGMRYAQDELSTLVRSEMMQRIDWHRDQGDVVVVVSTSLDVYLQPWCREQGLELICNQLETANDEQLTGRYDNGGDCGPEKVRHIRARYDVATFPQVYAYGDSHEDRPMLALAQQRWYRGRRIA